MNFTARVLKGIGLDLSLSLTHGRVCKLKQTGPIGIVYSLLLHTILVAMLKCIIHVIPLLLYNENRLLLKDLLYYFYNIFLSSILTNLFNIIISVLSLI